MAQVTPLLASLPDRAWVSRVSAYRPKNLYPFQGGAEAGQGRSGTGKDVRDELSSAAERLAVREDDGMCGPEDSFSLGGT